MRSYSLQQDHYVFTLSGIPPLVLLSVLMSVPCQHQLARTASYAGHRSAMMAVSQQTVGEGKSIPVPTWTRPQAGESIPVKTVTVYSAGKSIIQMLLRGR